MLPALALALIAAGHAEPPFAGRVPDAGEMRPLAAILLTTPPGVPEVAPPEQFFPPIRDAIHSVAVEWEILDSRETRYVLSRPEDFDPDLNMLRRRWLEMKDAPRVNDSFRFPDRAEVNELVRFNRAFRKSLDLRQVEEPHHAEELRAVMYETDRLYKVWDNVRDARCEFYYVSVRRHALQKIREMVGEDAYSRAELPPNVPTWRFNEMGAP